MSSSTPREAAKLLLDVNVARQEILDHCDTTSREVFLVDRTLQDVLAHLVIIIGEALRRAERLDPSLATTIPNFAT